MFSKKWSDELKRRADELRSRTLSAPRLAAGIPSLASLRIVVHEHSEMSCITYRKLVVVGNAAALFVIHCGDKRCEDGGHDITQGVMRALRARALRDEGVHECDGTTGSAACGRHIRYELIADYHVTS